jgi:phosphoglycolate phosphatase-like HAD superfamily hydrolase
VTTRPAVRAELIYELSWSRHIDFVVTGDQVNNRKPAPDSLDLAIAKYAMDNEGISVYLGDNSIDVEASKASRNKIISAGALWGSAKRDQLLRSKPDKVFYTFREFSSWILEKESSTISDSN